jgi:hypothetical protein
VTVQVACPVVSRFTVVVVTGVAAAGSVAVVAFGAGVAPDCAVVPVTGLVGASAGMVSVCALFAPVSVVALPVHPVASTAHCTSDRACGPPTPAPVSAALVSAFVAAGLRRLAVAPVAVLDRSPPPPLLFQSLLFQPLLVVGSAPVESAPDEVLQPPVLVAQCAEPEASPPAFAGSVPVLGGVPVEPALGVVVALCPVESVSQLPCPVWHPA